MSTISNEKGNQLHHCVPIAKLNLIHSFLSFDKLVRTFASFFYNFHLFIISFCDFTCSSLLFANYFDCKVMCMLFIFCNQQPGPDELAVVVISIRDEYFMRPTATCHFWPNTPTIIGGK